MLSDRDLRILAVEQEIVQPFLEDNCEGATINLTLDPLVRRYVSEEPIVLGNEIDDACYEKINIFKTEFWLKPKESVLIQTVETVNIPNDMSARIYERYSIKALSLLVSPAGYINPGFRGRIGIVAVNNSPVPVRLIPGIKICQLALFKLSTEADKPYGKQDAKYLDDSIASISKLHLDKEIQEFLKSKGVNRISNEMADELGKHLLSQIKESAKRLADILRKEEGVTM